MNVIFIVFVQCLLDIIELSMNEFVWKSYAIVWITFIFKCLLLMNGGEIDQ